MVLKPRNRFAFLHIWFPPLALTCRLKTAVACFQNRRYPCTLIYFHFVMVWSCFIPSFSRHSFFVRAFSECGRVTPAQCFNLGSPLGLIVPRSLAGLGDINGTCPEERRRFLLWVHTLFRLGLYLFRCKSARRECYVLSLCSGRWTGAHLLEEVSPIEIGALQIVFHYKAVIDVRG